MFVIISIVWITGVYFWFNRKKSIPENVLLPSDSGIIAMYGRESKIRTVFDQGNKNNMDIISLAGFTVRYSVKT